MKNAIRIGLGLLTGFAIGGNAMSEVITVLDPEKRIITNNDWQIGIFEPTLTLVPYFSGLPPAEQLPNSLRMSFREDPLRCLVVGNGLPLFPPEPFQTPAIYADGGLMLFEQFIDHSSPSSWSNPSYDPDNGAVNPAAIFQGSTGGNFNVDLFKEDDNAYIAYATSNHSMFGYVQIQRDVSRTQWRLIGYAFDPTGAPIQVLPLPANPTVMLPLLAGAMLGRKNRTP